MSRLRLLQCTSPGILTGEVANARTDRLLTELTVPALESTARKKIRSFLKW